MKLSELISNYPPQSSIADRVLLLSPEHFGSLRGVTLMECRVFVLIERGEVCLRIGDSLVTLTSGSFIDRLVWEPVSFLSMSADVRAWCIIPNYEFTKEALNDLKPAYAECFKKPHSLATLALEHDEVDTLASQLRLLASAMADAEHYYRPEICQTYFRAFILELGNITLRRGLQSKGESIVTRRESIMISFLKLVWHHFKEEQNIEFYAMRLCISPKHLSRVVKEKLGKTPYAVVRDELLQHAVFLLTNTSMSVQDIAAELHFAETTSFCKFFKKHKGVSPTSYRSRNISNI